MRYPLSVAAGQQLSSQSSLANYVVKGNIDLPEGGTAAPPRGIVMQFPGAQVCKYAVLLIGTFESMKFFRRRLLRKMMKTTMKKFRKKPSNQKTK